MLLHNVAKKIMKSHLTFPTFHEIICPPSVLLIYQILIKTQVDINWEEFRNKIKGTVKLGNKEHFGHHKIVH